MTLDDKPSHPAERSYVVRLHRDAAPADGGVFGRLENISTGRRYFFASAEELLACFGVDTSPANAAAPACDGGGSSSSDVSGDPSCLVHDSPSSRHRR